MQIGMFYQMQVPRPSSRSYEADRFLEMLDQVAYAEEMGLTSVWMADHQFRVPSGPTPAPPTTVSATWKPMPRRAWTRSYPCFKWAAYSMRK